MATFEPGTDEEQRGVFRPQRVLAVIVGALLIAIFLNATELENEAKAKPFGTERDVWVAIWKPFSTVSRALFLHRPRAWVDEALGRNDDGSIFELPGGATAPPDSSKGPNQKTPTPTPTPTPPAQLVRTPSLDAPLRLWVGGDSMSKVLGESVVRQATESGLIAATAEPQLESGLTRPDFFDWPGDLNSLAKPDADFEGFAQQELDQRRMFNYPPNTHVVLIGCRGPHQARAEFALANIAQRLATGLPEGTILGEPTPSPLEKSHGQFRFQLMLRSTRIRALSQHIQRVIQAMTFPQDVIITWDVDPVQMM